ncbi:MAG: hypothetical protein AAF907_01800 [Planctomycetota bacterium]
MGELLIGSDFRIAVTAAAELFATAKDAYIVDGVLPPEEHDQETADGRPATLEHCRRRLCRMLGADPTEPGADPALVAWVYIRNVERLLTTALKMLSHSHCGFDHLLIAGSGTPALKRWLGGSWEQLPEPVVLSEVFSPIISACLPAHAVARLCAERC